ncbi:MAG: diguanylate cyclase [Lachnospiraceae bacterium]|nr:diguanylate cyclase [Lachnospiraceae bacterium]
MKTKKSGRISGLMILVIIFLLVVNVTLGFFMTRQASNALISLIQNRMLDISNTAADMLDGDALLRLNAEDQGSEEYQEVMEILTYFQDNIALKYIYCIKDKGNKEFVFSVDPTVEDPGEFGSPIVYTDALYSASLGKADVDDVPYKDAWGTFYSAYSPVFTSDGRVGGIVAVDFSAEWYEDQLKSLIGTVIIVAVLSMGIGIAIVVILTRRKRKQYGVLYGRLNALAGKVEELVKEVELRNEYPIAKEDEQEEAEEQGRGGEIEDLGSKIESMQEELRKHISRIHKQAYLDSLTGVGNRAAYDAKIESLEKDITEKKASFAVAVLDMNGLKVINDNYGHERGDLALIDAAEVLKAVFGKENLFRIGGDEFFVIVRNASEEDMERHFAELDQKLAETNQKEKSYVQELSLSKGSAVYRPQEDADFKEVFKRADLVMYEDKRAYYVKRGDRRR